MNINNSFRISSTPENLQATLIPTMGYSVFSSLFFFKRQLTVRFPWSRSRKPPRNRRSSFACQPLVTGVVI